MSGPRVTHKSHVQEAGAVRTVVVVAVKIELPRSIQVRQRDLPGLSSSATCNALLAAEIIWALSLGPDQKEVCTVHLWPVSPFGMFSANISVPANASFGPVPSVSLFWARAATPQVLNSCEEWRRHRIQYRDPVLRSTQFDVLVADPRPPTAFIKFKHFPAFLQPGRPLRLALLLETYTGIPLQNHDVKIEISKTAEDMLQPLPAPEMSEAEDRGERSTEFARSTNASGLWSQDVMFGPQREVSWIPKLGDELTVKASARGPTGELLVQLQKLPVRLSPYEVEIRTSAGVGGAQGPLPGQDFTAWVELKAAFPEESWSIAPGPDAAKVFLVPAFAEDEKMAHGGSCMAWVHAQEEKQALTPDTFVDESGELMDGDDSGDSSDGGVSEAPETGRLRTMLRSHWPIRCLPPLVFTSLLLGALFFYSRRTKPLAREVVGQPASLYSAQCMACGRREVLQCIVHSDGDRQPSEKNAKRPQRPHAEETFSCNDGCMIWQKNVNDDACHCSDCEDEEAWSCGTCGVALRSLGDEGETIHVAKVQQNQYATDVGVGVGVGLSSAFALGFGLAFGLDSKQVPTTSLPALPVLPGDFARGIYYVVVVNLGLNVFNAVPFRQSRLLKQVVRRTVATIGRVSLSLASLRFPDWDDDDDDDDDDGRRLLRKPWEAVDLDVGIRCDSTATASEVEARIRNQTAFSAQEVMNSELQSSGATGKIEIVRVCRQQISLTSPAVCQFRMPAAEKYVLVAKIDVRGEAGMELIYGCTFIGQTSRDWRRRPVGSPNVFDRFEVKTEKPSYEIGETIQLEVWNPLGVKSRLLIFWGEQPAVVDVENVTGTHKVSLGTVMDQDCPMRLCQAYVFASSTEDPSTVLEHVPRSIHYPKAAPIWALQEVKFNISRPHNSLKVQVTAEAASTAPGSDVEIEVQVDQRGQAELAVMVVDKAWLDLRPSKLQDPLKAFEPNEIEARGPKWHVVTSLDGISSGDALQKATKIVRQRLEENPWVGFLSWPISLRRTDQSELDVDDYLERWGQELTEFPHPPMVEEFAYRNAGGPLMMAKGMAAPMALMESAPVPAGAKAVVGDDAYDAEAATEASGVTAEGTGKQVVLRKRFAKLVALNRALLEPGVNSWRTRVRLPQDLSTYVIRVVAVSHEEGGLWSWGSAESSVQTSQLVYGKPLLPRILRFMDVCRMGVSVQAVDGESSRPFLVEAVKVQNLRLLDEASQMVTMTSTSAEVRFTFASDISVGPAYVVFNIKDAETKAVLDSVAANIDVEVQQQGFRMASTTTIRANPLQGSVRKEAIAPLSAVPGSGDMSFSASVGFQAPILAAILELAPRSYEQWQPLGEDILALLLGGLIIRVGYGLEAAHEGLARAISAAEERLPRQVVPGLGLVNAPPEQRSWRAGEQPDLLLNSLALLTLRAAQALGLVPGTWAPLDGGVLLEAALKAVEKQRKDWARCCQKDMTLVSYIGQWHLAMFFLAHPPAQSRQDLQPLWEELLRAAITGPKGSELDILTRIASAQLRRGLVPSFGADRRAFVTAEALLSRTRVQGPTAYVASAEGSMHSASRWIQSLALWLWSGLPSYAQNTMVPLVATQLLSADRSPWQRSLPPRDLIMVSVSLLAFDSATGSSVKADIPLQIVSQSKTLLNVELRSAPPKLLTVWTAWPWSELPDTLPKSGMDLEIQVGAGSGLAIVSYAMDLIPVKPFLEPQFKGIMVQKIVQKLDARGHCHGPAVHIAKPGQLLCVTIQITSPDDLDEVEVVDLVPAGLEPLDEALAAAAAVAGEENAGDNSAFVWGLLLGRSWKRTVRRDVVRWRSAYMWGGTHTLSFNCIANAPGVYSLPSARAHSVKFPEVMGFSGAASFLVEDTAESPNAVSAPMLQQFRRNVGAAFQVDLGLLGASSEGVASMLPVACPQACPAAGSCNLAKGICECASSSGDLLPCEDISTQEPGPVPTQKPWRHQEPRVPHLPGGHVEDPEALDASHSQTVVFVLLLAVVAAGIYSYIARTKTPRNFAPPDMELSSEPFAALDEEMTANARSPLTVEEGPRQHLGGAGALAATE
ncbi:Snapc3, partial [Symbiodinium sp. CCMP2592]